jgi:hypothetical protein
LRLGDDRILCLPNLDALDRYLEDPFGLVDAAQVALPDGVDGDTVWEPRAEQRARRLGEKNVAAPTFGADPRSAHDVQSDVALLVHRGLTGVQSHAHAHGHLMWPSCACVSTLRIDRSFHRVARARDDKEEGVALRVDLNAVARRECLAGDLPVRGQQFAVAVAEALE